MQDVHDLGLRFGGWARALGDRVRWSAPGLILAGTFAMAASYVSLSLGGLVLRVGVGLLGARITLDQVASLGIETVLLVVSGVGITIALGGLIGQRIGLGKAHAVLSAGAVAICGASAALAISSVLPRHKASEQQTVLTVVGVTTLSTIAMVLYPPLTQVLGLSDQWAGVYLGATIHDVAQVVGAGYMISDEAGETATVIKLLRVMCLMPVVVSIGLVLRHKAALHRGDDGRTRPPLMPLFLIGFVALVILNSFSLMPPVLVSGLGEVSRWCLLTAVAALGVKTSLGKLKTVGPRPIFVLLIQTLLLAGFVGAAVIYLNAVA